jgi:hypothetical protein
LRGIDDPAHIALPPVCSVIAADQQQSAITTKRSVEASRLVQKFLLARRNDVLGAVDPTDDTIP